MEIKLHGMYGEGKVALIDDEDFEKVSKLNWRVAQNGYVISSPKHKLHRFVLGLTNPNIMVDHINHNKLDNRKSNLRICTNSQNQANALPRRGLNSKGVYMPKGRKSWMARICKDGKRIYLGHFKKREDAQKAYDDAGRSLFGSFLQPNLNE